jgi:hypothetical protein
MIDKTLTYEGLHFLTHRDQCRYGTSLARRALWREQNKGSWWRIEDVPQDAASPGLPAESKIGLGAELAVGNDQTSSTTVAAPENETTKPEVLRAADATKSGVEGPRTETIPLATIDHRPGCSDGSPTKKQKQITKARMLSRERMLIVINTLTESPILSDAARKAGIHRKTLEYWIKRSEAGDPGYDLVWEDIEWRFHEHCITAISYAYDKVLAPAWDLAMGSKYNGKMLRFLLEWFRPERYGKHRKIDVPQQGGVLVVGGVRRDIPNKVNNGTAKSVRTRKWKAGLRMVREEKK